MNDTTVCKDCGRIHPKPENEIGFQFPDVVFALSDADRRRRCRYTAETCILDERNYFVRGIAPLPVAGRSKPFAIAVWAEISRASFTRVFELWNDPKQVSEPRFPGLIANTVPLIAETVGLRVVIQLSGPNIPPVFFADIATHPLYKEQMEGIDEHRAIEYSNQVAGGRLH